MWLETFDHATKRAFRSIREAYEYTSQVATEHKYLSQVDIHRLRPLEMPRELELNRCNAKVVSQNTEADQRED